jgi:ABC-2 type transport system permease protein
MRNIWLIARREYLERVRTRSFIVMTILIPALMLGATVVPTLLMNKMSSGTKHLMVVAPENSTAEMIREQLLKVPEEQKKQAAETQGMQRRNRPSAANLVVDIGTDTSEAARAALTDKVKQKELDGVIFATQDGLASKKITFITRDISSLAGNEEIRGSISQALRRELLKNKGFTDPEIENALQPVQLDTQSPTGTGNPLGVFFTAFSMVMILYITVLLYGINVMRAILEEKTSRIMEVMLSIAQAKEMMAGKILGVGAVGLTQIGIWVAVALLVSSPGLISGAGIIKGILSAKLLVYFAVFFLLGYTLYSTLCAAVGSMVNSEQEAQQLQFLVMMPMIISVIIAVNIIQDPGSTAAVWGSLFPLTAPLIMFLRIALQSPPAWQIALSIGLMIATTYGLIWLCARIYRVGILMYGKKPSLPQIMKWIRYT